MINHGAKVTPRAAQELGARFPDYHWREERKSFTKRQKALREEVLSELPEVLEELIFKYRAYGAPTSSH